MSSITELAMLVDMTITQWTAAKHDRKVSQEVAELHGSDASMGRYHKLLIGREALETLRQVAGAAGQEHRVWIGDHFGLVADLDIGSGN